jgi:hypothetical protein
MAVERADLSGSVNIEQTLPVASAPAAQGQASPEGGQAKPRRRPPPEEASAESAEEALNQEETDQEEPDPPPHRIDSLA